MNGQGWLQLGELALALVLSASIGLEREIRHKSAGLRTHTLVGIAAALFMLISKYGFMNELLAYRIVLDLQEAIDTVRNEERIVHNPPAQPALVLTMRVRGKRPIADLIMRLSALEGVREVGTTVDEQDLEHLE